MNIIDFKETPSNTINLSENQIDEMHHLTDSEAQAKRFKILLNLSYELKEKISFKRILQWDEVSRNIHLVFCDTGLEFPEIREHIEYYAKWLQEQFPEHNIILVKIRPKQNFRQVIMKYGYPITNKKTAHTIRQLRHSNLSDRRRNYCLYGDERGKYGTVSQCWHFLIHGKYEVSDQCCDIMKKEPFHDYSKQTGRLPFLGIIAGESQNRDRVYSQNGCNVFKGNNPQSRPLAFWYRTEILRYVKEHKIPICSLYGDISEDSFGNLCTTGEQRTGCMFCMFGITQESYPNRFQRMRYTHPVQYDFCMRNLEENGLGLRQVLEYIGVPYE